MSFCVGISYKSGRSVRDITLIFLEQDHYFRRNRTRSSSGLFRIIIIIITLMISICLFPAQFVPSRRKIALWAISLPYLRPANGHKWISCTHHVAYSPLFSHWSHTCRYEKSSTETATVVGYYFQQT